MLISVLPGVTFSRAKLFYGGLVCVIYGLVAVWRKRSGRNGPHGVEESRDGDA
jgi:hypothetical protein